MDGSADTSSMRILGSLCELAPKLRQDKRKLSAAAICHPNSFTPRSLRQLKVE